MVRIFSLLGVYLFLCQCIHAQNNSVTIVQQIDWIPFTTNETLPFKGEGHWEDELPVYRFRIPLPEGVNSATVSFRKEDSVWGETTLFGQAGTVPSETEISYGLVYIRKETFLEVEIIPVKELGGNISVLQSFTSVVEYQFLSEPELKLAESSSQYTHTSVLASGAWQKVSVTETGIHRIPYSTLTSWGFSNPSGVAVYGYGGQMVPRKNSEPRPDDLPEVGVWHHNNAIYFYAHGPVSWVWDDQREMFVHQLHYWSNFSFYFLTEKSGGAKGIEPMSMETREPDHVVTHFDDRKFHEAELTNILKSGRNWFGERFEATIRREHTYTFSFNNRDVSKPVKIFSNVAGRSGSSNSFDFYLGGQGSSFRTVTLPLVQYMSRELGFYAHEREMMAAVVSSDQNIPIRVRYNQTSTTATGYMDFITLNARSFLTMSGNQLMFRDVESAGDGNVSLFRLGNAGNETVVWDITDIIGPKQLMTELKGSSVEIKANSNVYREYVAFNPSGQFPVPNRVGQVKNQNLHAIEQADYVIVVADELEPYAHDLVKLHQQHNDLSPLVVPVSQIYNEFSWGHQDPTAIRSFMRMLYDRAGEDAASAPRYLLLFGSGSYDNRSDQPGVEKGIVTYQSENSIHHTNTYVTDDYFGFLNFNEGEDDRSDRIDIGIGRFPVRNAIQARNAVEKIRLYFEEQELGSWRKLVTFFGEDGDSNLHMNQSDRLARKIGASHPEYDLKKIYLDSYPETTITTGNRSPEAEDAVNRAISEGTILFNFVGHGGPGGLTKKQVVTTSSVQEWNNIRRLMLLVTATCSFSRFDDHSDTSAGEHVFLNPRGGGIALLSTTRVVFAGLNHVLNTRFFDHVFALDENGERPALGDIIKNTKNESGSGVNKLNFLLLGDPALKLIYPEHSVNTTKINHLPVSESVDSLKALSKVHLAGEVVDADGLRINDYHGEVDIVVYDKEQEITTLAHEGVGPYKYNSYLSVLFKGKASVNSGAFEMEFIVPFDIRYNFGNGRISYYAHSSTHGEAFGAFEEVIVGGFNVDFDPDDEGPQVNLYLNHSGFQSGDQTGSTPILYAEIFDQSGINTSGAGIGHDITLVINGNYNEPVILNDYFQAKPDTYQEGVIIYQLSELPAGENHLSLRVWDTYNNSTTAEIDFVVGSGKNLSVRDFRWYPNPISLSSTGYFSFETDEPNSAIIIDVDMIALDGTRIGRQRFETVSQGNYVRQIPVSLVLSGVRNSGLYMVRFHISTPGGKETHVVEKILVRP